MFYARTFLFVIALVLFSFFKSCREFQFAVWGQKAEATVTTATRNHGRRGRDLGTFAVTYQAQAAGVGPEEDGAIIGSFTVDADRLGEFPAGTQVPIVYVGSAGRYVSRHRDESAAFWIAIASGSVALCAFWGWQVWRQADQDVSRSRRS